MMKILLIHFILLSSANAKDQKVDEKLAGEQISLEQSSGPANGSVDALSLLKRPLNVTPASIPVTTGAAAKTNASGTDKTAEEAKTPPAAPALPVKPAAAPAGVIPSREPEYSEYFENLSLEPIGRGTIVALENGKVKPAEKTDSFIIGAAAVKHGPAVNAAAAEEEKSANPLRWTYVALSGQVPVKVHGKIQHGDYIVLDDNGTGTGIPDEGITFSEYRRSIGRAMEDYDQAETGLIKVLLK